MSLRLTFKTLVAIACCLVLPGCGLWKPWGSKPATPSVAERSAAEEAERLDGLIDAPATSEAKPKRSFKLAWPFGGSKAEPETPPEPAKPGYARKPSPTDTGRYGAKPKVDLPPETAANSAATPAAVPAPALANAPAATETRPAASTAPVGSAAPSAPPPPAKPVEIANNFVKPAAPRIEPSRTETLQAEAARTEATRAEAPPPALPRETLDAWRPVGPRVTKSATTTVEPEATKEQPETPAVAEPKANEVAAQESTPAEETKPAQTASATPFVIQAAPKEEPKTEVVKPSIVPPVEAIAQQTKPAAPPAVTAYALPSAPAPSATRKSAFVPVAIAPSAPPPAAPTPVATEPTPPPVEPPVVSTPVEVAATPPQRAPESAPAVRPSAPPAHASMKSAFQPRGAFAAPAPEVAEKPVAPPVEAAPEAAPAVPPVKAPTVVINKFVPPPEATAPSGANHATNNAPTQPPAPAPTPPTPTPVIPEQVAKAIAESGPAPTEVEQTVAALRGAFQTHTQGKPASRSRIASSEKAPSLKSTFQPRVAAAPVVQPTPVPQPSPPPQQQPPVVAQQPVPAPVQEMRPMAPHVPSPPNFAQTMPQPHVATPGIKSAFQPQAPIVTPVHNAPMMPPQGHIVNNSQWSPRPSAPALPALPPVEEPALPEVAEAQRKPAPASAVKIVNKFPAPLPQPSAPPAAPPGGEITFAPTKFAMTSPEAVQPTPAPAAPATKKAAEDANVSPLGMLGQSITLGKSGPSRQASRPTVTPAAPPAPSPVQPQPQPQPMAAMMPPATSPLIEEPTRAPVVDEAPPVSEVVVMPKPRNAARSAIVMEAPPVEVEDVPEKLPAIVSADDYRARQPQPQPTQVVAAPPPQVEPEEPPADEPVNSAPIVNVDDYARQRAKVGFQGYVTTSQTVPRDIAPVMSPQEFERRKAVRRR